MVWRGVRLFFIVSLFAISGTRALAQPDDVATLRRQVDQLFQAGKFAEAIPLAQRALALTETQLGAEHLAVGTALNMLALLYKSRGQYVEAEPLYQRNIAIVEKTRGGGHADLGAPLNNLAELYRALGRYAEAVPLLMRAIANLESVGRDSLNVAYPVNNLALIYEQTNRLAEAEQLLKRSLSIREKNFPPEHPAVATGLNNLANLYAPQQRHAETESLLRRALAIREKSLGAEHPLVGQSMVNLAQTYSRLGRSADADPLYIRGNAIIEKALGAGHPDVVTTLGNRADFLRTRRRLSEAEPLMRRALELAERSMGPDHPYLSQVLHQAALLSADMGRRTEAETFYKRSLAARERAFGPEHPSLARILSNLGASYYFAGDWQAALELMSRGETIAARGLKQGQEGAVGTHGVQGGASARASFDFTSLVRVRYRMAEKTPASATDQMSSAFVSAQWARGSEAATSLGQMSVRLAKGDTTVARIVRERQDLISEWQARDKLLIATLSQSPNQRNAQAEREQRGRLEAIDMRLAEIDRLLAKDFPEYKALTSPEPLSIAEAQEQIRADEALVLFLDAPAIGPAAEEGFVWVVTKTEARWRRIERGPAWLSASVKALRCGLDPAALSDEGQQRCASLVKQASVGASVSGQPPFDLGRAHELYTVLFGGFEGLLKDKHLLVVPSATLTTLPMQVLLTEAPPATTSDNTEYARASWLARKHALTVLPSAASLKFLRQFARASKATSPFIGFGNPLLLGPEGNDRRAWERQGCSMPLKSMQVASRGVRSAISTFFRSGLANVEEIRTQYPLPETTDELCAVAKSIGAVESAIYLGDRAREETIKSLSLNGTLSQARVVHFATHGLLAGEAEMLTASKAEPALILTPPQTATEADDGLLTASEIAQLKLDADWVVLSACNTAAGESDKPGAEALSGLARAFFYAGARALLVSHWAVNSDATVQLITKAFDELKSDPKLGRAEALRRSMLALIDSTSGYAHPGYWAPFVVVGEGAR